MRALALLAFVAVAACAGRNDPEPRARPSRQAKATKPTVVEIPAIVSIPQYAELAPVITGSNDDGLPEPCDEAIVDQGHFQFMEDVCKLKRFPKVVDRDFVCPSVASSAEETLKDGRKVVYRPATAPIQYEPALKGIITTDIKIAVILVKRIDGIPHYRYVGNGTEEIAFQPWSTTKFMAIANAAATMRERSNGRIGLTATVDHVPVGDLVSVVHNYVENHYTSNSLAKWFHDVGGRSKLELLLHDKWLHRPAAESLGGNYGPALVDLSLDFKDGKAAMKMPRDAGPTYENRLSTHTMVEFLKRLVMHREDESTRMPFVKWDDLKVLFYGAPNSKWFQNQPGGMSADRAIYMQVHEIDEIARRSNEKFRIFSKSGMGGGALVHAGYGCFPSFDASGEPLADEGRELFVSARIDAPGGYAINDRVLAKAYREVIARVMDGTL